MTFPYSESGESLSVPLCPFRLKVMVSVIIDVFGGRLSFFFAPERKITAFFKDVIASPPPPPPTV